MARLPFERDSAGERRITQDVGEIPPFRESASEGKSAPAGDFFSEGELPVYAISDEANGAFRLGPVDYSPENPPLPIDPMKGYPYPPGEGKR